MGYLPSFGSLMSFRSLASECVGFGLIHSHSERIYLMKHIIGRYTSTVAGIVLRLRCGHARGFGLGTDSRDTPGTGDAVNHGAEFSPPGPTARRPG